MKKIVTLLTVLSGSISLSAQNGNNIQVHDELSNKEEVITLPQSMNLPVDSLLMDWNSKYYLYSEQDCKEETAIPYTSEQIQERLRRLPAIIELSYNNIVEECIDKYVTDLRSNVSYMLGAGNFYMPLFEETLDGMGMPLELRYLPVVESALNPSLVQNGAVGLWQINLSTAHRYGLEVNSLVDERRDPYKSTVAAAQYLKELYAIYKDWNLTIAAFNCGPSTVNKAMHRASGKKDYWAIYPHLPKEVRGYVPSFIAANYVMNYYCKHGIAPMKAKYPMKTDTVLVNRNVHMKQIEAVCGIDIESIKALNPQYSTEVIPGATKPRVIRLPQDKIMAFIDQQEAIYQYQADQLLTRKNVTAVDTKEVARAKEQSSAKYVTVRRGDTLGGIAHRNHTTVSKIKRLNGMRSDRINPGKRLRVR